MRAVTTERIETLPAQSFIKVRDSFIGSLLDRFFFFLSLFDLLNLCERSFSIWFTFWVGALWALRVETLLADPCKEVPYKGPPSQVKTTRLGKLDENHKTWSKRMARSLLRDFFQSITLRCECSGGVWGGLAPSNLCLRKA